MKTNPSRGSHLPVLMKLVHDTPGAILEMGCGIYSTIFLHWACYPTKRRLVTYESKPEWFRFLSQFGNDFHEVHLVENWDSICLSEPWSVAFIDHAPDERRYLDIKKLLHADYVVAHDAENRRDKKYRYSSIYPLFKYRHKYSGAFPPTLILSNRVDLSKFSVI